jgi:hypothetical protein
MSKKIEPKFFDMRDEEEDVPFTIADDRQERCAELELLFQRHFPSDTSEIGRVY